MKCRSTATNLVSFTEFVASSLNDGVQVDCIYTDFSKCYDRINHNLLISKLKGLGIHGNLLNWLESFHINRKQIVKLKCTPKPVNNSNKSNIVKSESINVPSGCIQGGHLSSILFLCFVNDIITILPPEVVGWLFADDFKIAMRVRGPADAQLMQEVLRRLHRWCQDNLMELNLSKCKVLTYHTCKNPYIYPYTLNNTLISRVNQMKDLGVTFDHNLKFSNHYLNIKSKALRLLGFLYRHTQDFRNTNTLKTLYYAYVRSGLEYCSVVWSPQYKEHINSLESIQHKFLRTIAYKQRNPILNHDYTNIMQSNNIMSLENRRKLQDLMFLFKILHNKIDSPELLSNINIRVNSRQTRLNHTFKINRSHINIAQHCPIRRIQHLGNIIGGAGVDIFSCSENDILNAFNDLIE
ncbi:hypothetical protein M8J77_019062 [Diaphorina citri]|nr:hypothetical protein M8J77_019062 [Diaphorina citri]